MAAPTEEERAQPYLWRFWRHLPGRGMLAMFDRSWYGRVLVERVEGFCSEGDFMRAYTEINDFEEQLTRHRFVLVKLWLQVSQEEQLRRFKEREATAFKRFKITPDDWRNRDKWDAYERAVCDMVDRTSTEIAPWTLVEAEDKYYARVKVLRTLCEAIEKEILTAMRVARWALLGAAVMVWAGCQGEPSPPQPGPPAEAKRGLPVDLVAAPLDGDVQEIVQRELARAGGDGHRLLVYVGATWCEPCQRFHQAAREGKVDALFPGLRLLEFDLDRDRPRLEKAGYTSKMIPLFALPRPDGAASGTQIEGSIKGAGAVDQIAPRLRALLEK